MVSLTILFQLRFTARTLSGPSSIIASRARTAGAGTIDDDLIVIPES
jgi:hypothetical protein